MVDVDRNPEKTLSEICSECVRKKIGLAISNPCFELWLFLHVGEVVSGQRLTRRKLESMLRQKLGSYNKSDLDIDTFLDKESIAVRAAKKLDQNPQDRWPQVNPGTYVYRVMEVILKLDS